MKVVLERYHGLGNDYLVFDPNHNELELDQGNVKMICDRNEGLGADGVLEGPILKEDVFPFTISVAILLVATAAPHPNVLNFTSRMI